MLPSLCFGMLALKVNFYRSFNRQIAFMTNGNLMHQNNFLLIGSHILVEEGFKATMFWIIFPFYQLMIKDLFTF